MKLVSLDRLLNEVNRSVIIIVVYQIKITKFLQLDLLESGRVSKFLKKYIQKYRADLGFIYCGVSPKFVRYTARQNCK